PSPVLPSANSPWTPAPITASTRTFAPLRSGDPSALSGCTRAQMTHAGARRYPFDVRVGDRVDQCCLAATLPGFLEDRDVLFMHIRLSDRLLRFHDEW